jgi:tRNA(Ile)-lysidine synthase
VISGEAHVALAVSGGSDSMALLRLAHEWSQTAANPPLISVLTVDHALRPASAGEARTVSEWTAALDFPHHVLKWTGPKPVTGLQAKARAGRYDAMTDWCLCNGATAILTAHTLDDQAETVLMRLRRTTSPDSLAGIAAVGAWGGVALVRPLLGERRADLRRYLAQAGQGWIEDPSNDDERFERVRIRAELANLGDDGALSMRLASLAAACARTVDTLERATDHWTRLWLTEDDAGICYLPIARLAQAPDAVRQRILARVIQHYGGGQARPEREELERLSLWLSEGPVRRTLGGAVLGRRKHHVWVTREASRIKSVPGILPETGRMIWDRRFSISGPAGSTVRPWGDQSPECGRNVPVFARRAYPQVVPPGGDLAELPGVRVDFLRLKPS